LFGAADGFVYCLRSADGVLTWRFRAAPRDRRMVAFEQVESVWPVPGSVLVQDGVATVVAGRCMFLDGGLRFCRLDVATGRLLGERTLDERDPQTGQNLQNRVRGLNMPVALNDVLSSDGEFVYLRSQVLDLKGNPVSDGGRGQDHLFAPYGFADDEWFHRSYWMFSSRFQGGVGGFGNGRQKPAGRILANNDATVFGYGRKPEYYRWGSAIDYHLFAAVRPGSESAPPPPVKSKRGKRKSSVVYRWSRDIPLMVRALAVAGDVLLARPMWWTKMPRSRTSPIPRCSGG
jgi:hypothetical protein